MQGSSVGWCNSDIKYEIGSILSILLFSILVIGFRLFFYLPFEDAEHYLSMYKLSYFRKNSKVVAYLHIYKLVFGLLTNFNIFEVEGVSK